MFAPQGAQCLIGQIRQWDETILVPLAAPDMNQFALTVDIAHLQGQGLCETQSHEIGGGTDQDNCPLFLAKIVRRGLI